MTGNERTLLDFETAHPDHGGRKMDAIWATFRYPPARYYQRVLQLVHRADVVAEYPQTCARVQRFETRESGTTDAALRGQTISRLTPLLGCRLHDRLQ